MVPEDVNGGAERNLQPMRIRQLPILFGSLFLVAACTKEEPVFSATMHATCKDCVVSYAVGAAQSKTDTLYGMVDAGTGDTVPETTQWTVQLKDGDNLFLRACRLWPDSAIGDMAVWVDGGVRTLEAHADTSQACAVINQAAYVP